MPTHAEERAHDRTTCNFVVPFVVTQSEGSCELSVSEGMGHALNQSKGGLLLLLPETVQERQIVEIQTPDEPSRKQVTKLVEVCWTRPLKLTAQKTFCLAGSRFVFEVPTPQ